MKIAVKLFLAILLCTQFVNAQKLITKKHFGTDVIKEEYQVNANGERNGFYKSYNPDGVLLYSYNYKNGIEHGTCIDYAGQRGGRDIYCYGKPLSERVMEDGSIKSEKYYGCANNTNYLIFTKKLIAPKIYERVEYHKNGNIKEKFNENSSFVIEKGVYEKYHENGKLAEKGMVDNGNIGNWLGFYENGDTMFKATYVIGIETYYKKFYTGNKVEFVQNLDDNFENISKTEYYQNGKVKSEKISKTFPFKYECGSSNDPKNPKNWKELAERRIRCGGQSYSPFDNCYVASEKKYKENGELNTETVNELRVVKAMNKVVNKKEIEAEDLLWQNIQKDNSYQNLGKYYNEATINFYSSEVDNIFYELNDKYQMEIDKKNKECNELETDSKYKNDNATRDKTYADTKKSGKIYPIIETASNNLVEKINAENKTLSDLNPKIESMKKQISEGGSIDLSKINKYELSVLVNSKLETARKINSLSILKAKLWDKFVTSLTDKNLKKSLSKVTTTEEMLEFVKQ